MIVPFAWEEKVEGAWFSSLNPPTGLRDPKALGDRREFLSRCEKALGG